MLETRQLRSRVASRVARTSQPLRAYDRRSLERFSPLSASVVRSAEAPDKVCIVPLPIQRTCDELFIVQTLQEVQEEMSSVSRPGVEFGYEL